MNNRTAILAAAAALLLGLITFFALRTGTTPPAPAAGVSRLTRASEATALTVSRADETASVTYSADLETWLVQDTAGGPAWPAEQGAAQGALRLLRDLARLPAQPVPAPDAADTTKVTLSFPSQPDLTLLFSAQSLGGKTRMFEQTASGALELAAPAQTAEVFSPRGILAWRREDLLAAPGAPVEVSVTSNGSTLSFKQVDDKWTLMLPVPAPVDPSAMKELLAVRLPAKRMLTGPQAAAMQNPAATLTRTSRINNTRGDTEWLTTTVSIGGPADTSQETFYASALASREVLAVKAQKPDTAWGPLTCVVDGAAITAIARTPEYYVSKRAVQAPAADVTRIRLLPPDHAFDLATPLRDADDPAKVLQSFQRTLDGWTHQSPGSDTATNTAPAAPENAAALAALTKLLCETPAPRLHLQGLTTPISPLCTLAISDNTGLIEVVAVGTDENATTIYLRSGRVIREYTTGTAGDSLTALRAWTIHN